MESSRNSHDELVKQAKIQLENYQSTPTEEQKVLLQSMLIELLEHKNKLKADHEKNSNNYEIADQLNEAKDLARRLKRNLLEELPAKHKTKSKWQDSFFKAEHGRQIVEIESALGDLYRLILNDQAPKMRTLVDPQTKMREGVMSKAVPGYKPFSDDNGQDVFNEKDQSLELGFDVIPNNELVRGGIAKVLVAAYVLEEDDLHWGNIGTNKDGNVVKIDHDHSAWSWTQKYFQNYSNNHMKLDSADMESFPVLNVANPSEWVARPGNGGRAGNLAEIGNLPEFQEQKWMAFLKVLLIDRNMLAVIAQDHFSSPEGKRKFVTLFENRFAEMKTELLKIPEFREYVANNNQALDLLILEFEKHGKKIDSNVVKSNYEQIRQDVMSYTPDRNSSLKL